MDARFLGLATALAFASPAAAVTGLYGAVEFGPAISSPFGLYDPQFGSVTDFTSTLEVGTTIAATFPLTGSQVEIAGAISAEWFSENAGEVEFSAWRWSFTQAAVEDAVLLSFAALSARNWIYSFFAERDGMFTMDYEVTASGDTAGLGGWNIGWCGAVCDGRDLYDAIDPTVSGTFTRPITAGTRYSVDLYNPGEHFRDYSFAGQMNGRFAWSITEVPEPASWALMIVGFGLVGGVLRQRRRRLA